MESVMELMLESILDFENYGQTFSNRFYIENHVLFSSFLKNISNKQLLQIIVNEKKWIDNLDLTDEFVLENFKIYKKNVTPRLKYL